MTRLYWISAMVGVGVAAFALAVALGHETVTTGANPVWQNGGFVAHTQQIELTILPVTPPRGIVDDDVLEPNFAVQPGVPVTLHITNYTTTVHTFTVPELGVNVAIEPGATGKPLTTAFTFTPNKRGVFAWHCVHCPGHMTGVVYAIVGQTGARAVA